jgi:ribonuclease R
LIVHRLLKAVLAEAPERHDGGVAVGSVSESESSRAGHPRHTAGDATPWSKRREKAAPKQELWGPLSLEELHEIADESSRAERRADEAERELMEWKKAKFMEQHLGDEFAGLIISVTKFGFFVELNDLFVEGLVPLASLTDDRYLFHENTREIIGQHSRKSYRLGQQIRVIVERIDPLEKKIQFALVEEMPRAKPPKRRNVLRA